MTASFIAVSLLISERLARLEHGLNPLHRLLVVQEGEEALLFLHRYNTELAILLK